MIATLDSSTASPPRRSTVERVVVRIWERDIAEGLIKSAGSCPVARAFRRRYPEAINVECAPDYVEADLGDGWMVQTFKLTPAARAWIKAFDAGHKVSAGDLHLFDL